MLGASATAITAASCAEVVELLDAHHALLEHSLRDRLYDAPLIASGEQLRRYLVATLGDRRTEVLRALYLDSGNRLLNDELVSEGDAVGAPASIRTILNRALELHAAALIIVHNHPGGQSVPSAADRQFTQRLAEAGRHFDITLQDHLIVAGSECLSMRACRAFQ